MKITGLAPATFLAIAAGVDIKLVWKETAPLSGIGPNHSFSGYFARKGCPSGPGYCYKVSLVGATPTLGLNKPCHHVLTLVIAAALAQMPTGGSIWGEKCKFTKGWATMPLTIRKKLNAALVKKGLTCVCEQATVKPQATTTPKQAQAPTVAKFDGAASPTEPSTVLSAEPIAGDPIATGTGDANTIKKGKYREVMSAITGLYILQEAGMALIERGILPPHIKNSSTVDLPDRCYHHVGRFWTFKTDYERTLARNLFDYLTVACVGEMRHHSAIKWADGRPENRTDAYAKALNYDPRSILPVVAQGFNKVKWAHGGFGGKKWGKIAESTALYFKFIDCPVVFADHVVDLSHNGGVAFNKGYLMNLDHHDATYLQMLDHKRKGSLLGWRGASLIVEPEVWEVVEPLLTGVLAERFEYRSNAERDVTYRAWDAECPRASWRDMPEGLQVTVFADWRAAHAKWREKGKALGFEPGIAPAAELHRADGGLAVRATIKPKAARAVPALKWGSEKFTLTLKGSLSHEPTQPEAAEAAESTPAQTEQYHAVRDGQPIVAGGAVIVEA